MGTRRTLHGLILFVLLGLPPMAADAVTQEEADTLYRAGQWAAAERAYRELATADSGDARAFYRLAVSLRNQGRLEAAEMWLGEAEGHAVPARLIRLEQARLLAARGRDNAALDALAEAADAGLADPKALEEDPALKALADRVRFGEILAAVRRNQAPCEHAPECAQFDFWLGHWEVRDPAGNLAGHNLITREQSDCVLTERSTAAGGGTGMSMNYYDPAAGQWRQHWVSPRVIIDIRGGLEDGVMRLDGTIQDLPDGRRLPFRGTWTPRGDGVVRQHFEQGDANGAWSTWFDGYDHPVPAD